MVTFDRATVLPGTKRWEEIAKAVLRKKSRSVKEIARALHEQYGPIEEVIGGDELYPSETTWYFTAPKRA